MSPGPIPYGTPLCLGDGDHLAWCIDDRGESHAWIIRALCECCQDQVTHGDAGWASAPHEQSGPLGQSMQRRVDRLTVSRCGYPTKNGRPCRIEVARAGEPCAIHARRLLQDEFGGKLIEPEDLL